MVYLVNYIKMGLEITHDYTNCINDILRWN